MLRLMIALASTALLACTPAPAEEASDTETTSGDETADEGTRSDGPSGEAVDDGQPAALADFLPAQGERAFGVYLATVAPGESPEALLDRLAERGFEGGGVAELGCDHGAPEALSLPAETLAVSLAFRSRADADAFVARWGEPVIGVAEFTAYCRD